MTVKVLWLHVNLMCWKQIWIYRIFKEK